VARIEVLTMVKIFMPLVQMFGGKALQDFKKLRTDMVKTFVYYANVDTSFPTISQGNAADVAQAAREKYRSLASELDTYKELPFYQSWLLPHPENLEIARANLVALSRMTGRREESVENARRQDAVRKALKTTF
jgi:hypothetical protein